MNKMPKGGCHTRGAFRFSAAFMRPFFLPIAGLACLSLLGRYAGTFDPLFTGRIIDALTIKNAALFWRFILIITAFQIFGLVISLTSSWLHYLLQKSINTYAESRLFISVLHMPPSGAGHDTGRLLNVFLSDLAMMTGIFSGHIPAMAVSLCTMSVIGYRLFSIDRFLFVITLLFSVVPLLLAKYFGAKQARITEAQRAQQDEYTSFVSETLHGLADIRHYEGGRFFRLRFTDILTRIFSYLKKSTIVDMLSTSASFGSEFVINMSLFIIVGYTVLSGKNTVGTIVAALMYSQTFRNLVSSVAHTYKSIIVSLVSARRVHAALDSGRGGAGISICTEPQAAAKGLCIENLSFGYTSAKLLFNDYGMRCAAPGVYLIKGQNGSGKTTLLNIIAGCAAASESAASESAASESAASGRIVFEGYASRSVSYVPQDPFVFSASIRDNLCFGKKIDPPRLSDALRRTRLDSVIAALPDGLETRLGTAHHVLSQGQIQRLALARCLVHGADIILFDEAENALDIESARAFEDIIRALQQSRLVIMVTHRSAYDSIADGIIQL